MHHYGILGHSRAQGRAGESVSIGDAIDKIYLLCQNKSNFTEENPSQNDLPALIKDNISSDESW